MRMGVALFTAALAAAVSAQPVEAQKVAGPLQLPDGVAFEVLRVRPNVYMFASTLGNVVVQVGNQPNNDGVLLVDTGSGQWTDRILTEIKRLSDKPIRYVVNTSADADHTGGNAVIAKAGSP